MTDRKILAIAAMCVVAAIGVTGCGNEKAQVSSAKQVTASAVPSPAPEPFAGMTPDQIADRALDATKAANGLKAKGSSIEEGEKTPTDFDVAIAANGDCDGTATMKGANASVRQVGTTGYLKGDAKLWETLLSEEGVPKAQRAAAVEILKGRWVKVPAEDSADEDFCDADDLTKPAEKQKTGLTKGANAEVGGKKTVVLTKTTPAGETIAFHVAAEGEPYLLKYSVEGGKDPRWVEFREFSTAVTVTAPSAEETTDLDKLGG
ncbi:MULTISPECIES: hypothetical protein [Streptomyces]|uniref:hypothetical protein n=1 Tax=Streptomyces TaxID=1883 RepID=UPI0016786481|nr:MULTISPECIES: hypothetical protein [Streptomyces]MBD3579245.1 hypothetical protein [Streptomyces sp. KD18]GGT03555.1 lipoprotein [Streptomyces toxytricini]